MTVEEAMDTGAEGDGESVAEEEKSETITTAETESFDQDGRNLRKLKRKIRSPEGGAFHTPKKLKDLGPGHSIKKQDVVKELPKNSGEQNQKPGWEKVQSRKDKRKERRKLPPEKPLVPPPKPNQKPIRVATRPEALIIRPANKDKYSEILTRIKADVCPDQVSNTVEKIRRTATGNILITLSKGSSDRDKDLQKTIAGILKEDANVISTGPEEDREIRDIDDNTTKDDILTVLQEAAGNYCGITVEAIKIRKVIRSRTQIASVTLAATVAQKVVGKHGKVRIGWTNCRIRTVLRPVLCYKCWHFGHRAVQCTSEVDRSKLCIKCGEEGHKIADCNKPAKCALCGDQPGTENNAHHAGTSRCPVYQEALKKITDKRK